MAALSYPTRAANVCFGGLTPPKRCIHTTFTPVNASCYKFYNLPSTHQSNRERRRSLCLVFYQNHLWNEVTSTVRASGVIRGCGATVKRSVRKHTRLARVSPNSMNKTWKGRRGKGYGKCNVNFRLNRRKNSPAYSCLFRKEGAVAKRHEVRKGTSSSVFRLPTDFRRIEGP